VVRTRLLSLLLLAACGGGDESWLAPRILDGAEVDKRNGAVQLRIEKHVEGGVKIGLCTGMLVGEKCVVTAGHCVEFFGQQAFLDGAKIWHPEKTNNDEDGKATPAKGETVATAKKVAVLGKDEFRDLAVVLLSDALPGPTLSFSATAPKPAADVTILGNGTTETGKSAHRQAAAAVIGSLPDPKNDGYAQWALLAVGKPTGRVAEGDSGGPALFGTGVFGIAHGADPDTGGRIAAFTNLHATETRKWLKKNLADICGIETLPEVDDGPKPKDDTSSGDDGGSESGEGTTGEATSGGALDTTGETSSGGLSSSGSISSSDGTTTVDPSSSGGTTTAESSTSDSSSTSDDFPPDVGDGSTVTTVDVDPIHHIDATPIDLG
jgi:hypothetical protein